MTGRSDPSVAVLTYTTHPRGGAVHALRLAEELHRLGLPVHLFSLGDPEQGFFRPVSAPHTIFPAPARAETVEARVSVAVEAMAEGLATIADGFDIAHAEDCIAAGAALEVREDGADWLVLRTVHHVDEFTSPVLIGCQQRSILAPDERLVVSEHWRDRLRLEFGTDARVVSNGVDLDRFRRRPGPERDELRARVGARDRFLFLTVGGVEPRKGSLELFEALAKVRASAPPGPVLAIVGGHSFQDHAGYRRAAFARAEALGLREDEDLVVLGTVDDAELPGWYAAADAFVFPSVREGFGLVVLEALAAGLPVVTSDLEVFREYLTDGADVLMAPVGDADALAQAMGRLIIDPQLRGRLATAGPTLAARYPWERSARQHVLVYRELAQRPVPEGAGRSPSARREPPRKAEEEVRP